MKHVIITLTILLTATICFGQEKEKTLIAHGKDINKIENEYIEIVCYTTTLYGKKWAVNIDIGEEYVNWKGKVFKDENGNEIDFRSGMDAVNYLCKCGWTFVSNTAAGSNGAFYIYYLMYKKKS
jgi:hypothetical protein